MSITSALNTAATGLAAASRGVQIVANNVANAGTDGYARREVMLSSLILGSYGTGVRVTGIDRIVNPAILGDLRLADSSVAAGNARLDFRASFARLIGTGQEAGSLSDLVARMEAALVEAAGRPDSTARLTAASAAAGDVARQLNKASEQVQAARMAADSQIAEAVTWLNSALEQVRELNVQIIRVTSSGADPGGLQDERSRLISRISEWIPVRELPRPHGAVALVTPGGAMLLDGKPAELAFSPTGFIVAEMVVGGALSGLVMNDRAVPMDDGEGKLGGGRLGALFDIRDNQAIEAQALLDSLAHDLYARFADPAVDPSLTPGQPGLFTDLGGAFDGLLEVGFAARIRLNAQVDPQAGGELWRLRDGLQAAVPGPVGDSAQLNRLLDALAAPRVPTSGPLGASARSAGGITGDSAALWQAGTFLLETSLSHGISRAQSLRELHLADGVDTDAEMQRLLLLEQSYGANARVISTIDDLIRQLLSI